MNLLCLKTAIRSAKRLRWAATRANTLQTHLVIARYFGALRARTSTAALILPTNKPLVLGQDIKRLNSLKNGGSHCYRERGITK